MTAIVPAECRYADRLGLRQARLRVDHSHREKLGQQLLRHFHPKLVACVQRLHHTRCSPRMIKHGGERVRFAAIVDELFLRNTCSTGSQTQHCNLVLLDNGYRVKHSVGTPSRWYPSHDHELTYLSRQQSLPECVRDGVEVADGV